MFHNLNRFALPGLLLPALAVLAACGDEAAEADTSYEEAQPAPVDLTNPDDAPVPDNEVGSGDVGAGAGTNAGREITPAAEPE